MRLAHTNCEIDCETGSLFRKSWYMTPTGSIHSKTEQASAIVSAIVMAMVSVIVSASLLCANMHAQ